MQITDMQIADSLAHSRNGPFVLCRALLAAALLYAGPGCAETLTTPTKPGGWNLWLAAAGTSPKTESTATRARRASSATAQSPTAPHRTWVDPWKKHPTLAWTELTLSLITKYQQNPLRAARALTYVHTAMHDAIALSARSKLNTDAQKLALHTAASSILEYFYPQEPMGRFGALGYAAALAVSTKSEEQAAHAQEIGRSVAASAIARAASDGAAQVWDVRDRPPLQPGGWQAAPPLNIYKPAEPTAGSWRTWVLKNSAELQPPQPVTYDSTEYWQETKQVLEVTEKLTPEQKEIAERWNLGHGTVTPAGVWNLETKAAIVRHKLDFAAAARVYAALNVAMMDAFIACWSVKFTYWTQRPVNAIRVKYDPDFLPHLVTPPFPSYVSGHSTVSGAAAEVLAAFFPKDSETFRQMAREAAISRLYGGIHFESDNNEGLRLGQQIGQKTVQRLQAGQ